MPRRSTHTDALPGLWPPTWPMALTLLRLLLLPVFLWLLLAGAGGEPAADGAAPGGSRPYRGWALLVFAVMALTDLLDGFLARRLNQVSRVGALLDPAADKLLIASSVLLLSFPQVAPPGYRIPPYVVAAVFAKDLLVTLGALAVVARRGAFPVRPRPLGKFNTFLQLILVLVTLLAPEFEALAPVAVKPLFRGLWWVAAVTALASCLDYFVVGARLARGRPGTAEKAVTA